MAKMVKYNDKYISMAYELVNAKSTDDEIKAVEDLYVIDVILSGENACVNLYNLDSRLREEYKAIEIMENIACQMQERLHRKNGKRLFGIQLEKCKIGCC